MKISTLCWGITFLGIGAFWLAINLGYFDYYVWIRLLSFWPIALIAVGLNLIFKKSKFQLLRYVAPLLIAIAFISIGISEWRSDNYRWQPHDIWLDRGDGREVYDFAVDSDPTAESLKVDIDFGLGELWIGSTSQKIFDGNFEYRRRKPRCDFEVVHGEGRVRIRSRDYGRFVFFGGKRVKNDARIFIGDFLPLELDLDIGAAGVDLDLSDFNLKRLKLDTGASRVDIKLGCRAENANIIIEAGASRVHLDVPSEMGLEIVADNALTSTNFKSLGLQKRGGKYYSDNFDIAGCKANIDFDSGVSKIEIEYY